MADRLATLQSDDGQAAQMKEQKRHALTAIRNCVVSLHMIQCDNYDCIGAWENTNSIHAHQKFCRGKGRASIVYDLRQL